MDRAQVEGILRDLARSQGSYSRLLARLEDSYLHSEAEVDAFYASFADCKDTMDIIMQIEG